MNKEIRELLDFHHKNLKLDPSEIEIKGAIEKSGVSGHQALVVNYEVQGKEQSVFVKMFNRSDSFYSDIELARSEAYALEKTNEAGVPTPKLILFDPEGEIIGKPALVMSVLQGTSLGQLLTFNEKPEKRDEISITSFSAMQYIMRGTENIKSPDGKFGSIFNPSWMGEVKVFGDFLTRGLLREFRRMNMLDNNRVFKSSWAKGIFNWAMDAIKDFNPEKFQLCHGDLVSKNILGRLNTNNSFDVTGVVDWEYAYWGPVEKDWGDFLASVGVSLDFSHIPNLLSELQQSGVNTKAVSASMVHRWLILINNESLLDTEREKIIENINKIILN